MKATLSRIAIADLIEFVAVNAENYDRYAAYAEKRGWKTFTPAYFHTWVNRRRPAIQAARNRHLIEVRKIAVMDRVERLRILEVRAGDLEALLNERAKFKASPDAEDGATLELRNLEGTLRIIEQQRKILQAHAQESGDWNTKPDEGALNTGAHAKLADRLMEAYEEPKDSRAILIAGVDEFPEDSDDGQSDEDGD